MTKRTELLAHNLVIDSNVSIEEAMVAMTDNQRGAVIVIDADFTLLGVVSDGEVRRGMLHGATTIAPVSKVMNTNAIAVRAREEGKKIFERYPAVTLLPVIDAENRVTDVLIRDEHIRKQFS